MIGLPLTLIWGLMQSWWPALIGAALKLPRWVWIGAALVVGILIYGHEVAKRTAERKDLQYTIQHQKDILHQQEIANAAIKKAQQESLEAQARASNLQTSLDGATHEIQQWRDHGRVCIPANVTDRLRYDPSTRRNNKHSP